MLESVSGFVADKDWPLLIFAILGSALVVLLAVGAVRRARYRRARLQAALNNMSEGLCMFDGATRLVLCNDRYVEIYGLDPTLAKPGVRLRDLLAQRKDAGTFAGDPERYTAETLRRMRERGR